MSEPTDSGEFRSFSLEGEYQDGVTSRSMPGRMEVTDRGARIVAGEEAFDIAPDKLWLSDRIGDTPRRIEWGEAGVFVTHDNAAADRLRALLPGGGLARLAFGLESHLPLAIAALLVVAVSMGSVLFFGIPSGARYLAQRIPDSLGERAAEEVMEVLDRVHLKPSSLPRQRADELRAYLRSQDDFPRKIHFREAGKRIGANAFALPGGHVVITDELIELAASDDEVLAVYLHEVGHARGRHAETSVLQNSTWLVMLTLLTGDVSGMSQTVFAIPVLLGQLAFSRELEREADDYAIAELKQSGRSPELLAAMLERMSAGAQRNGDEDCEPAAEEAEQKKETAEAAEAEEGAKAEAEAGARLLDYLSTHPATSERLARIRAAVAQ